MHFWDSSGMSPMPRSLSPGLPCHVSCHHSSEFPAPAPLLFFFLLLCIKGTGFFCLVFQFLPLCSSCPSLHRRPIFFSLVTSCWISCRQQHAAKLCQSRHETWVCAGAGGGHLKWTSGKPERGSLWRRRLDCREDKLLGDLTPKV